MIFFRYARYFIFFIFSGLTNAGFAQSDTSSIKNTHWLIGTWMGMDNGKPFYETWRKKDDNSLICYSINIKGSDTTVKINSSIRLKDNVIVFEDPLLWRAKRIVKNEMTFEMNHEKGHHRIIWLKTKDNHWLAIIQYPLTTYYYDLVNVPDLDNAINKYLPN